MRTNLKPCPSPNGTNLANLWLTPGGKLISMAGMACDQAIEREDVQRAIIALVADKLDAEELRELRALMKELRTAEDDSGPDVAETLQHTGGNALGHRMDVARNDRPLASDSRLVERRLEEKFAGFARVGIGLGTF